MVRGLGLGLGVKVRARIRGSGLPGIVLWCPMPPGFIALGIMPPFGLGSGWVRVKALGLRVKG